MNRFSEIQNFLENIYGIKTGVNVAEFIRPLENLDGLGKLIIDQQPDADPNVALLLDRDIFEAWTSHQQSVSMLKADPKRVLSVVAEELSHFVYFAYNHQRGRNITALEMEIQSEIDRILVAFHSQILTPHPIRWSLFQELTELPYGPEKDPRYEISRSHAVKFLRTLTEMNPLDWKSVDFKTLREFFHNDLAGKIHLSQKKGS